MKVKKSLFEGANRVYSAANTAPDEQKSIYPTGAFRMSMSRTAINGAALVVLSTGRLQMVAFPLFVGETVTSISWVSGTTAGATLTHVWYSLWSSALAKLQVTSDDTAATWAVSTVKTLNLATPYVVPSTGLYYVGIVVVGTTIPTLIGNSSPLGTSNTVAPIIHATSSTGQTTPGAAPSTAGALTGVAQMPWCWVS